MNRWRNLVRFEQLGDRVFVCLPGWDSRVLIEMTPDGEVVPDEIRAAALAGAKYAHADVLLGAETWGELDLLGATWEIETDCAAPWHRTDEPACDTCGYDRTCGSCGGEGCARCEETGACQTCTPARRMETGP